MINLQDKQTPDNFDIQYPVQSGCIRTLAFYCICMSWSFSCNKMAPDSMDPYSICLVGDCCGVFQYAMPSDSTRKLLQKNEWRQYL
jgi:hypothetical protein